MTKQETFKRRVRADLLPGFELGLRSKPASKSLRFSFARDGEPIGVVMFSLDAAPGDRLRVTVTHEKLDSVEVGEHWKGFWSEWLQAVDEVAEEEAAVQSPQSALPAT